MKKRIPHIIALAAILGLSLAAQAQNETDQTQFPAVTQQPVDDAIPVGASTTFSVATTNADSIQWLRNGAAIQGQTNTTLTIDAVSTNDVGYYSAEVVKGSEVVPTRSASLNVMTADSGGFITVFGSPVHSSGNSGGCPGPYAGYVNYTKTISQGWGWGSTTNCAHTATDANRSDTIVIYTGRSGDNGCSPTSVTVPNPTYSPKYRFTIYFPTNSQVPTNSYPITLSGFDP